MPCRKEPIETINDRLERLRAGQVSGRIVYAHHAYACAEGGNADAV